MEKVNINSLSYIIEVDKKAREKVEQARSRAAKIDAQTDEKKKKMLDDYQEHTANRLKIVEDSYGKQADNKIAAIKKKEIEKTEMLKKAMDENRDRLEQEIFKAVTGENM